jgi:hypothetical protein
MIFDHIPPLYQKILPIFFENYLPDEGSATCGLCVMLGENSSGFSSGHHFSPASKCCTHYPELPNYLVGALLSNSAHASAEGVRRIREKIRSKIGITPMGIERPAKYSLLINNSLPEFFGRSAALICPFFEAEAGRCSVAPYWDSVCSTWFCKYVSGEDGVRFWSSLQKYLEGVEYQLKRYLLMGAGLNVPSSGSAPGTQKFLTLQELDALPPLQKDYLALWGEWAGKEEEFYRESYRIISELDREKFAQIAGVAQYELLSDVEKKYTAMLMEPIPDLLLPSSTIIVEDLPGGYRLVTAYSSFDPIKVSNRLYRCLSFFDGIKTNNEVSLSIKEDLGFVLSPHMLEKLYRFRILTAVAQSFE